MDGSLWRKAYVYGLTIMQIIADYIAIELSFLFGYLLWIATSLRGNFQPPSFYLTPCLFSGLLFLLIFYFLDLYRRRVSLLNIEEPKNFIKGIIIGFLLMLSISFFYRGTQLSRLMILYSVIFMIFFIWVERSLMFDLHAWFHRRGISSHPVLIYGAGKVGQNLLKKLIQYPKLGYIPIGFLDDHIAPGTTINGHRVLGRFEDLPKLKKQHHFHHLFIAMPSVSSEFITNIIHQCHKYGISFKVVPNLYEIALERSRTDIIDGIPLVDVKNFRPKVLTNLAKRVIDLIVSAVLLIILSPLLAIISLLIKRDSPGPIIFKHNRIGKDGKPFRLYKFRTMYHDTNPYAPCPKQSSDPRITRFGRWLRRTSLDELPQLINVLKGDMSLVGPRPEMPFIVEKYYDDLHRERFKVKPGITGLWQISGDRRHEIHENIEYDLYYIENQSLLLDLVIFLKTIGVVLRGLGT